jgi:hypothetical protein
VLGPWQLTTGGDGKNIRMICPFASGTYTAGAHSFPLANVRVVIEVGMEWVPNPDQFSFVIDNNAVVNAIKSVLDRTRFPTLCASVRESAARPWQRRDGAGATAGARMAHHRRREEVLHLLFPGQGQRRVPHHLPVGADVVEQPESCWRRK